MILNSIALRVTMGKTRRCSIDRTESVWATACDVSVSSCRRDGLERAVAHFASICTVERARASNLEGETDASGECNTLSSAGSYVRCSRARQAIEVNLVRADVEAVGKRRVRGGFAAARLRQNSPCQAANRHVRHGTAWVVAQIRRVWEAGEGLLRRHVVECTAPEAPVVREGQARAESASSAGGTAALQRR